MDANPMYRIRDPRETAAARRLAPRLRRLGRALVVAALALMPACRSGEPPPGEAPSSRAVQPQAQSVAAPPSAEADANAPLQRAVGLTFGLPLPEGLELLERDEDVAHFSAEHTLAQLDAFYRRELRSYRRVERDEGTKFEPESGVGTDVYIVDGPDAREVFYFRAPVELPELGAAPSGEDEEPVDPETLPFAQRYPWPQGPVAPPEVQEIVAGPTPEPTAGGEFYVESYEEVDGEQVRVLRVRTEQERQAAAAAREAARAETTDFPPAWRRLPQRSNGSYDRGDGHRSLRPTPTLGPDGRPLPFYGTQRVGGDMSRIAH